MVDMLENIRNPKSLTDFPAEMKSEENKICLYTAFSALLEAKNGIGPEVEYVCHADYTAYRAEEKKSILYRSRSVPDIRRLEQTDW